VCDFCDIQNAAPINIFSEEEIERIVIGVYSGLITPQSLDVATYLRVAEKLTNGVYNGFGKALTDVEWNSPDFKMLNDLRNNVYVFSGAKQYHQVREMVDAIYDGDRIKPFSEYKKTGTEVFEKYNGKQGYLRAEYNAAISQSRSASMWMEIESNAELLPMLTYSTVGDGRVRPEHAMLNNISRPVNDRFWDSYFPPNGWNCRCTTLQTDSEDKTSLKGFKKPDTVPPEFMMNAGKQKIVFSDKHPYFVVADRDKDLASNNFYMPKP
jgi:SPP1 gp7 family putative phage head morphogenesis protein